MNLLTQIDIVVSLLLVPGLLVTVLGCLSCVLSISFHFWSAAKDETAVSDLSDGRSMEWQEWLNSRLHSWGMLSLVDEVLKAATLGDLMQLRELVVQAWGDQKCSW